MSWNYSQATGRLTDPAGAFAGVGYSGQPPYVNDGAAENIACKGPIPCGMWEVVGAEDSPTLGPLTLILSPDAATRSKVLGYGRDPDTFRMHGERLEPPPGFASDGCLVQIRTVRLSVYQSTDKWIQVGP